MSPLSLYEIDAELAHLEATLLENGGEITPETEVAFEELLEMRAEKVAGYVAVIRRLEASAEAVKAERQRLQAHERAMANAAKRLKERLCQAMCQRGERECETPLGRVRVQRASRRPVVLKVAAEDLPEPYRRVRIDADLSALAEGLDRGDPDACAAAEYGEASAYVRIY